MGFFKKLFKRKKGGTFFGNLIRGVASQATGGLLGNGQDLKKWEAEQAQKEYNNAVKKQAEQAQKIGKSLVPNNFTKNVDSAHGKMSMAYVKKHWYWFVGGITAFGVVIWLLVRPKNSKKKIK